MSDGITTKCLSCDGPVWVGHANCPRCWYPRFALVPCVICKQPLPESAKRCNKCSVYQGRFRRHPVASSTVMAILAVLTFSLPRIDAFLNLDSNTTVTFVGADEKTIKIHASNTGLRASTLQGYRLNFGGLRVDPADLSLSRAAVPEAHGYVPKEGEVTLPLTTGGLRSDLSRAKLPSELAGKRVTLEVDVRESNGSERTVATTFPADQIREFILNKVPVQP